MLKVRDKDYKVTAFSGGEQHPELRFEEGMMLEALRDGAIIHKRLQSASDIMDLLLLVDILRSKGISKIALFTPYIPYARQDRRTTPNTAQSLKVFAGLINSCKFEFVRVIDPHSMVAENVIDNMVSVDVIEYIDEFIVKTINAPLGENQDNIVLVSPDVGAIKKVESYAKRLGLSNIIAFHKERDPATGDIKGINMISGKHINPGNKHIFLVDDICDGGRTFIELIKAAPHLKNAKSLNLFVTHGIFSYGLGPLLDAGFTNVGCTNSFDKYYNDKSSLTAFDKLTIIPLNHF